MLERVAKLESDVGHILTGITEMRASASDQAKSLADVRERFAKLETKVDNLPSKEFVATAVSKGFGFLVTATVLVGAIVSGITLFQAQLRHLLSLP